MQPLNENAPKWLIYGVPTRFNESRNKGNGKKSWIIGKIVKWQVRSCNDKQISDGFKIKRM
ncbi:hypothetical protein HanRHA438_Chr14g0656141 [Helianthus annuus]|nr:hypothetical protein HanRHA438_Chr14g0656141 [Helianthus annuus]